MLLLRMEIRDSGFQNKKKNSYKGGDRKMIQVLTIVRTVEACLHLLAILVYSHVVNCKRVREKSLVLEHSRRVKSCLPQHQSKLRPDVSVRTRL